MKNVGKVKKGDIISFLTKFSSFYKTIIADEDKIFTVPEDTVLAKVNNELRIDLTTVCDFCQGTGYHLCPDVAEHILIKCTKKGCTA